MMIFIAKVIYGTRAGQRARRYPADEPLANKLSKVGAILKSAGNFAVFDFFLSQIV